jgi:hypothetical protein
MNHSLLSGVLCAFLLTNVSCQVMATRAVVDVSIENKSDRDIHNARARFGDFACSWGIVSSGAKKIYGNYPHPINVDAELHWEVDGQHKVQKLDLRRIYTRGKSGRLSFTIHDDRAEVSFRELPPPK